MHMRQFFTRTLIASICFACVITTHAQDSKREPAVAAVTFKDSQADQKKRFEQFEKLLTGAKLTGKFTVVGRPSDKLSEETYEIKSAKKMDEGDFWMIKARIKYGKLDVVVPIPLEVKWAGDTPMITLTDMKIPLVGQGKFGARVIFHGNKYAGTWSHDKFGGHMFGTVESVGSDQTVREKKQATDKKVENKYIK